MSYILRDILPCHIVPILYVGAREKNESDELLQRFKSCEAFLEFSQTHVWANKKIGKTWYVLDSMEAQPTTSYPHCLGSSEGGFILLCRTEKKNVNKTEEHEEKEETEKEEEGEKEAKKTPRHHIIPEEGNENKGEKEEEGEKEAKKTPRHHIIPEEGNENKGDKETRKKTRRQRRKDVGTTPREGKSESRPQQQQKKVEEEDDAEDYGYKEEKSLGGYVNPFSVLQNDELCDGDQ